MTILELVNSRLDAPRLDQADEVFLEALDTLEGEIAAGLWKVTDTGTAIGCTDNAPLNRRIGSDISPVQ